MAEKKQWQINKAEYNLEYEKNNMRKVMVRFHNVHDIEMIKWIESKPSMQGYIKSLIQKDMDKENRKRIKNRGTDDE